MASRTENSFRNIKFALVSQVGTLLIGFVTRSVFVRMLSTDYLGVNGLFSSILMILSLAELGVGAALTYHMYEPLAKDDQAKIVTLMEIFRKSYTIITCIILLVGLSITPFIYSFINEAPDVSNLRLIYVLFVINSASAYVFAHKMSLISADQKDYIVSAYRFVFTMVLNILQIIFLILTRNYVIFISLQIGTNLIRNTFLAWQTDKLYPYLKTVKGRKLTLAETRDISQKIRAMMLHKIGGVFVVGTDNIILARLVNLTVVGLYSNYTLVLSGVQLVIGMVFRSISASIGNLGATSTKDALTTNFRTINFLGFWIHSVVTVCLFVLFNPFITVWLGAEFALPKYVVAAIVLNFYLNGMRTSVLTFKDTLGLFYQDRYKPFFEAIVNIVFSIALGIRFGAVGVFIGTAISTITVCLWVEPYVLYKHGLNDKLRSYFGAYLKYGMGTLITVVILSLLFDRLPISNLIFFFLAGALCFIVTNLFLYLIYGRTQEFKDLFVKASSALKLDRFLKR